MDTANSPNEQLFFFLSRLKWFPRPVKWQKDKNNILVKCCQTHKDTHSGVLQYYMGTEFDSTNMRYQSQHTISHCIF